MGACTPPPLPPPPLGAGGQLLAGGRAGGSFWPLPLLLRGLRLEGMATDGGGLPGAQAAGIDDSPCDPSKVPFPFISYLSPLALQVASSSGSSGIAVVPSDPNKVSFGSCEVLMLVGMPGGYAEP